MFCYNFPAEFTVQRNSKLVEILNRGDIEEAGNRRNFHDDAGPGKTGSRLDNKVKFDSTTNNEATAQLVMQKTTAGGIAGSNPPHTMHSFAV